MNHLRTLAAAWGLVVGGAIALVAAYPSLSDQVVLYRVPGDAPSEGAKSWLNVGRIALMGAGQLGAATTLTIAARSSAFWTRLWQWMAFVAGAKTLLECFSLIATRGSAVERSLFVSTLLLVGLFLLSAARWWQRGPREPHPPLTALAQLGVLGSLALWAVFALAPRLIHD